jgi:hypothetical protein
MKKLVFKKGMPRKEGLYLMCDEKQSDLTFNDIMLEPEYKEWLISDYPNYHMTDPLEDYKDYYFYGPLDIVTKPSFRKGKSTVIPK